MKLEMKVDTEGMGDALVASTKRTAKRAWTGTQLFLAACVGPALFFLVLMVLGLLIQAMGGGHAGSGIGAYPH